VIYRNQRLLTENQKRKTDSRIEVSIYMVWPLIEDLKSQVGALEKQVTKKSLLQRIPTQKVSSVRNPIASSFLGLFGKYGLQVTPKIKGLSQEPFYSIRL